MKNITLKYLSPNEVEVRMSGKKDEGLTRVANTGLKVSEIEVETYTSRWHQPTAHECFEVGFNDYLITRYGFKNYKLTIAS